MSKVLSTSFIIYVRSTEGVGLAGYTMSLSIVVFFLINYILKYLGSYVFYSLIAGMHRSTYVIKHYYLFIYHASIHSFKITPEGELQFGLLELSRIQSKCN